MIPIFPQVFGMRGSDIDKYSRVIFPIMFLSFHLVAIQIILSYFVLNFHFLVIFQPFNCQILNFILLFKVGIIFWAVGAYSIIDIQYLFSIMLPYCHLVGNIQKFIFPSGLH